MARFRHVILPQIAPEIAPAARRYYRGLEDRAGGGMARPPPTASGFEPASPSQLFDTRC